MLKSAAFQSVLTSVSDDELYEYVSSVMQKKPAIMAKLRYRQCWNARVLGRYRRDFCPRRQTPFEQDFWGSPGDKRKVTLAEEVNIMVGEFCITMPDAVRGLSIRLGRYGTGLAVNHGDWSIKYSGKTIRKHFRSGPFVWEHVTDQDFDEKEISLDGDLSNEMIETVYSLARIVWDKILADHRRPNPLQNE